MSTSENESNGKRRVVTKAIDFSSCSTKNALKTSEGQ